jgi:uncharacterized protein
MYRTSLGEDRGMIFIYRSVGRYSMWMKNTPIPLSVAFIDSSGKILNIEEMSPQSEQTHTSAGDARYALEMNSGWFRRNGIARGDKVHGLARLPAAE